MAVPLRVPFKLTRAASVRLCQWQAAELAPSAPGPPASGRHVTCRSLVQVKPEAGRFLK